MRDTPNRRFRFVKLDPQENAMLQGMLRATIPETMRLTEREKAVIRKLRHGTESLQYMTLEMLENITKKLHARTTSTEELSAQEIKDMATIADANTRFRRMIHEQDMAAQKAAQRDAESCAESPLDADYLDPRVIVAYTKMFLVKLGMPKARALLEELEHERPRVVPDASQLSMAKEMRGLCVAAFLQVRN